METEDPFDWTLDRNIWLNDIYSTTFRLWTMLLCWCPLIGVKFDSLIDYFWAWVHYYKQQFPSTSCLWPTRMMILMNLLERRREMTEKIWYFFFEFFSLLSLKYLLLDIYCMNVWKLYDIWVFMSCSIFFRHFISLNDDFKKNFSKKIFHFI